MAVAVDATGTAGNVTNTTIDYTGITVGSGSDRALMLCATWGGNPGTVTATWDNGGTNQSMTLIGTLAADPTWGLRFSAMYGLVAPTSGNLTLRITTTNSVTCKHVAISFTGADQTGGTTTFANATSATSTGATGTLAITSNANSYVVMAGAVDSADATINTGTSLMTTAGDGWDGHAAYAAGSAPTASLIWNTNNSWRGTGCSVAPVRTVALTGTATGSITEADVVSGGKTIILTATNDTYVGNSIVTPVIEAGDATVTTIGTAADPWSINRPVASTGDLIVFIIAWDDSTAVTSVAPPSGPNGETISSIVGPVASASTEMRMEAWYTVATGSWSSGTLSFNPSASETCRAVAFRVPAGEFDSSTPIGASSTSASAGTAETNVNSPAFSAGASDGDGRLVIAFGSDADAITVPGSGTDTVNNATGGGVGLCVETRTTAVSDSESIASITATIAGDSWATLAFVVRAPTATPFESARQAMIDGLDSAQSEGTGWNAEVRDNLAVTTVARTSDTVVTITLSAQAAYDITAQETITATVPGSILSSGLPIVASPTFTVDTSGGGGGDPEGGLIGGKLLGGGLLIKGALVA